MLISFVTTSELNENMRRTEPNLLKEEYQISDLEKMDLSKIRKLVVYTDKDFQDLISFQKKFKIPFIKIMYRVPTNYYSYTNIYDENGLLYQKETFDGCATNCFTYT